MDDEYKLISGIKWLIILCYYYNYQIELLNANYLRRLNIEA